MAPIHKFFRMSVDFSCFPVLLNAFPHGRMLPNLRELEIIYSVPEQYLTLFFQDSLTRIDVGVGITASAAVALLYAIAATTPQLQTLDFRQGDGALATHASSAFTRAICSQRRLEQCRVYRSILPSEALNHLAQLPTLTELRFGLDQTDYRAILSPSSQSPFIALRVLHISSSREHIEPLVSFLHSIHAPQLHTFCFLTHVIRIGHHIEHLPPPSSAFLQKLFDGLSKFSDSLQHVSIDTGGNTRRQTEAYIFANDIVRPLLRFRKLTNLDLSCLALTLRPGDAEAMARAWPHMRSLCLWTCSTGGVPYVTPTDLLHFARHCPKLERLAIDLSCATDAIPTDTRPVLASPLRELHLGRDSVIEESAPLAAFLFEMFPEACVKWDLNVAMDGGELAARAARIDEVQRMKKALEAGRMQDRDSLVDGNLASGM